MNVRAVFFCAIACLFALAGCDDDPGACEQGSDCFAGEVCYQQRCTPHSDEGDSGTEPDTADDAGGAQDGAGPADSGDTAGPGDSGGEEDGGGADDTGDEEDAGPAGVKVEQVAVGGLHTCALLDDGTVRCWGRCSEGQCGTGDDRSPYPTPTEVGGLSDVRAIAAGHLYTCAIKNDASLWCWGSNTSEQIVPGEDDYKFEPTDTGLANVQEIGLGYDHICAGASGELSCWGDYSGGASNPPESINGVSSVSAGFEHSCAVVAGEVQCWGSSTDDKLGEGNPWVIGISDATAVEAGRYHTCVLLGDGTVSCWGDDAHNQLGDAGGSQTATPVFAENLDDVVELSVGYNLSCARTGSGGVKCWGSNDDGYGSETPNTVFGLTSGVVDIDVGASHACAVKESGEVVCWGNNQSYKLGDGTEGSRERPVEVQF